MSESEIEGDLKRCAPPERGRVAAGGASYSGIRLSRFASDAGLLTKRLTLLSNGTLKKDTGVYLSSGTVENLHLDSFDDFGAILTNVEHHQALAYGISLRGSGPVMSEKRWGESGAPGGVLLRNREHFDWPSGHGILMLDYDPSKESVLSQTELLDALYKVVPEMRSVGHFWRPSASSCVFNASNCEQIVGISGQRIYVWINNAREIERAGKLLEARLWLAGYGRIEISRAGRLLERTLVDGLVWQPERLDFAAGARCEPPLEQRRPAPVKLGGNSPLDARVFRDLSGVERQKLERIKALAKSKRQDEAGLVRAARIDEKAVELGSKYGLDSKTAREVAQGAYEHRRLMGNFVLISQDGTEVTVADLLDEPEAWHGQRFHDPLDSEYPDDRIAMVNLFSGGRPYLFSHAHGGVRYELCRTVVVVQIPAGGTALATKQTLDLMNSSMAYYERAKSVVVVAEGGDVQPLGQYALKQRLECEVSFQKWDARQKEMKQIDCPDEIARRVLDMRGERGLPILAAVVQHPILTPTGRLIETPGYDQETGLLVLNPSEWAWPRVPPKPADEDVLASLERLWRPVAKFPFLDDTSRAIALAALLTAVVRRALPTAPAFMFAAPSAGSGKTLLASCVLELAGRTPAMSLPDSEEEIHKVLIAQLRRAPGALFFDNVVGVVNSKTLNAILTAETYEGRILGISETSGALPTNVLVVLTGNNARPAGDTCRRMLVSTIDPKMEEPYRRRFDFDPVELIRADRMELIVDALTILRGWIASQRGEPPRGGFASFEAWDRLVRQAVLWVGAMERAVRGAAAVGFGDPTANVAAQFAEDDETEALGGVLLAWFEAMNGEGVKASTLFGALDGARRGQPAGLPLEFASALNDTMPKVQSAKGVSRWLRSNKGRVVHGLRIEGQADKAMNNTTWYVRRVTA